MNKYVAVVSILAMAIVCTPSVATAQIWKRRHPGRSCVSPVRARPTCAPPACTSPACTSPAVTGWGHDFRSLGNIWKHHTVRGTSPDGTKLVLCQSSRELAIYDLTAGRVTQSFVAGESVFDATFSPDGTTIAVAEWRDGFTLRDAKSLAVLDSFKGSGNLGAWQARFSAAGDRLNLYSWWHEQKQFWTYDLRSKSETGWPSYQQDDSPSLITRERFASNGNHLLSVRKNQTRGRSTNFRVWVTDPQTGQRSEPRELDDHDFFQFDLSPDGRTAILMRPGDDPRIVDLLSGVDVAQLGGHETWVTAAAFSPDGRYTVTAGGSMSVSQGGHLTDKRPAKNARNKIVLHDARTGDAVAILRHGDVRRNYMSVGFSRDSRYVWAITRDKEVVLWGNLPSMPTQIDPLPHADETDRKQASQSAPPSAALSSVSQSLR